MGKEHSCRHFAAELTAIRLGLMEMGGMVELMIYNSAAALTGRDSQLAQRTISADAEINRMELEIDQRCLQLLAQRQPAACDLRLTTMAMKIVTDLERMGDHCVSIAREALELNREAPLKVNQDLRPLSQAAGTLVKDALDAFVRGDADHLPSRVLSGDQAVHRLSQQLQQELVEIMRQNPSNISRAVRLDSVTRYLERIADHATNIAEMVIFMVSGKDVRHPEVAADTGEAGGVAAKSPAKEGVLHQRQALTLLLKKRASENLAAVRRAERRRARLAR